MTNVNIYILLIMLLIVDLAEGQSIRLKMYGIEDGLSDKVVRNITQDKYRHLWIGTEYGLNRFDGHEFRTFLHDPTDSSSISNNSIFGLATDQDGNVWVGTDYGLNKYSPFTNKFERFLFDDDSNSISNNHIRTVFVDKANNVWIGTEDGLNLLNRKENTFKCFYDTRVFDDEFSKKNLSYDRINFISQASNGSIWIALDGGGVKVYENGGFRNIEIASINDNRLFNIVRTIYQSADGIFWFGTDGGLVKYADDTRSFKFFEPSQKAGDLGFRYVWSIIEKGEKLWLGTYGGGLYIFDKGKENFESNRTIAGRTTLYEDNLIWTLFKDQDGNIWTGMDGSGGLGFYDQQAKKFNHYLGADRKIDRWNVSNILVINDDSLLLDTSKGRFLLSNKRDLTPIEIKGLGENQAEGLSIKYEQGYLLTSQQNIAFVNDQFETEFVLDKGVKSSPTCIVQGPKGNIWIGTLADGLLKLDPATKEISNYFSEGNSKIYTDSRSIKSLHFESDSILWVAGIRSGLFRFNINTLEKEQYLVKGEITVEAIEKGAGKSIWLGTYENGLLEFNTQTRAIIKSPFSILQSNQIKSIVSDDSGKLWITSNKGLKTYNPSEKKVTSFGPEDGLQDLKFNKAFAKSSSGDIYFGGINGINRINIDAVTTDLRTQPVTLEGIKVNDQAVTFNTPELSIYDVKKLDLPYNHNDITIDFSANNFVHTGQINFQYQINDNDWRDLSDQNRLLLSNLAPNQYKVAIRSINHDGIFSEPRIIELNIFPPWWRTWWAYLLFSGSFLIAIAIIFYLRLRRHKNQRLALEKQVYERTKELEQSNAQIERDKLVIEKSLEERETLLREIHHRVKNNLQIIANLLYLQSSKSNDEQIKDILEEGQGRVRSMALIHQKLYENDDLKSIPFGDYISELVHEIKSSFGEEGANVSVEVDAKEIYFDVDNAVPLGLIINELATNAFKYAFDGKEKGKFNIYVTRSDGNYELRISDNGRGIPEEIDIRKTRSLGLRLVRILSEQLEGEYAFENDGGMSFNLKFAA